jgi:hypothetical protein
VPASRGPRNGICFSVRPARRESNLPTCHTKVPISPRSKSFALNLGLLLVVTSISVAAVDGLLVLTGLLPPSYRPGDSRVGWYAAPASGAMVATECVEMASGIRYVVQRNEDGVRTDRSALELAGPSDTLEVVASGDSHTDLCANNERTHFGETATALSGQGHPARAYAFGSGKYSPLQAYLAIEPLLSRYAADVFVLNLYTGNDFYDMLRIDDRPYLEGQQGSYRIAQPVWYSYDPPGRPPRSRVLFGLRRLADLTGVRRVYLRVSYLRDVAARQNVGAATLLRYMNDLRRSADPALGYPQAYTAQMLNQQLFFHHFPGTREESLARVKALLEIIRTRHPDVMLLLSPIPSYQAVVPEESDSGMRYVLDRLPITYKGGVAEEELLYRKLEPLARDAGWVFVDNLSSLRAVADHSALYNHFDFHIEPTASAIIGRAQASAIARTLEAPVVRSERK